MLWWFPKLFSSPSLKEGFALEEVEEIPELISLVCPSEFWVPFCSGITPLLWTSSKGFGEDKDWEETDLELPSGPFLK
ncbi:hypothetical protein [Mycoplasma suis]|uniref:hypothetical protein n=1 Tax=Mycoplasma suis TaxID=57372 RepID=UPI0005C4842C|nr:hypothetical protein [Mycoplasma suis]